MNGSKARKMRETTAGGVIRLVCHGIHGHTRLSPGEPPASPPVYVEGFRVEAVEVIPVPINPDEERAALAWEGRAELRCREPGRDSCYPIAVGDPVPMGHQIVPHLDSPFPVPHVVTIMGRACSRS